MRNGASARVERATIRRGAGLEKHEDALNYRSKAILEKKKGRVNRLRKMTMAQAIREMEALCSFPWPIRRRTDPPVPSRRFITD